MKQEQPRVKKPRYCCIPGCHSTAKAVLDDGTIVSMHRLPSAESKAALRRQWLKAISSVRADTASLTKEGTRICSLHFTNNMVEKDSVPNHFPTAKKPRKQLQSRREIKYLKPQPVVYEATETERSDETPNSSDYEFVFDTPDDSVCGSDVAMAGNVSVATQCDLPSVRTTGTQTPGPPLVKTVSSSVQTQKAPDITYEDLLEDKKVKFYTGFVNFGMFMLMFNTLAKYGANKLNYWDGAKKTLSEKQTQNAEQEKPGPKRKLRPIDEFLLTCMRLRLGLLQEHLADIFKISQSTVSRTLNTWLNFMFDNCQHLVAWPSPEQIRFNIPRAFQDFPNCQIVLDCTEFFCERPSSLQTQWQTWSEYKHHNTMKVLIGVAPNGFVNFVSRLWGGRASDRHIFQQDGLLPRLHPHMTVMADKGFTIEDLLPRDIDLNVPPRIPSARPMTEKEFFVTTHIASARIVVEMKMEEIKNYRVLQGTLPLSEAHLAEQIVFLCTAWTNFCMPLLK